MNEVDVVNKVLNLSKEVFHTDDVTIDHRLLGGMSNYTYVVNVKGELYVVRIPGAYADLFVDRTEEFENLRRLEPLGITTKTIYFDIDSGIKISKFIKGTPLNEIKDNKNYLALVTSTLKRLHESEVKALYDYDYKGRVDEYEKHVLHFNNQYFKLKETFDKYVYLLEELPRVFSHGDTQLSNFILGDDGKIYLVDYEFSGNATVYFDIAIFGFMNFKNCLNLAKVYFARDLTDKDLLILYLLSLQQYLQWYNVARIKEEKGLSEALKIPFDKVAENFIVIGTNQANEVERLAAKLNITAK